MNDQTVDLSDLPALSDAAMVRIEDDIFTVIASERSPLRATNARARVRRRRWLTGTGIAAAFVVGVLVTPPILGLVNSSGGYSAADAPAKDPVNSGGSGDGSISESAPGAATNDKNVAVEQVPGANAGNATREIIANGRATVHVKNIADAAAAITALAEKHGGFVESTEVGKAVAVDQATPTPTGSGYGYISIRVPSADLTAVIAALGDTGEVLSSSISKQDVTTAAIDLRARVDATKASVQRLTELMAKSGSVADLIQAEVALTDRQALLESYQQQLTALEDQVAMSSLQVELTRTATIAKTDPAGFGDGLLAGWNGLIVSLNALMIALGFILPWLGIAAVGFLIVWLVRRARRSSRNAKVAEKSGTSRTPGR